MNPRSRLRHAGYLLAATFSLIIVTAGCQQGRPGSDASQEPSNGPAPSAHAAVVKTIPAGTVMSVEILDTLASNKNRPGDRFTARVVNDVVVGNTVAIPAGSGADGVVTEAVGLHKIGGRAKLRLEIVSVSPLSGSATPVKASYFAEGKSETKKDAATIGGAAVGGALLGRVIGHHSGEEARGTAIGGAVGAATGTAIAASTKGQEVVLPHGHVIRVSLQTPAQVTVGA